jgi:hypothetical protein
MPQHAATPPIAQGRDGTVYLMLDDFGELGSAYRETDAAKSRPGDGRRRSLIRSISTSPARGGLEHRRGLGRDVSADTARKVLNYARDLDQVLPAAVRDFVERACL